MLCIFKNAVHRFSLRINFSLINTLVLFNRTIQWSILLQKKIN
ncbi:hypothetical protein LEP1GSC058_2796 [Leptospira fainei serovar Hurstbridge str. BUT 6]|uniref:Uncharacterized protein n=1 Tax=Leptospira fainei serovar Hurstbridge str. BUT 6 TaxID=1193011 RepID=S3URQ9_9LEPT|nr:hypothetical protein LEP1GSC058_2796 [Leptospira fainei serovar Hurstbridge str. BUT 6]